MKLPAPSVSEEDTWIESLMNHSDEELIAAGKHALGADRLRLAGRIACLLNPELLAGHPDLERAHRAARMRLVEGGLKNGWDADEWDALIRRRKSRMKRAKDRHRRSLNPKDPRFRRK